MGAPVIVCGQTEMIGRVVIDNLKPEYDVIHFVMTLEGGVKQIPAILKGEQSPPSDSALGSKDYSRLPIAVIVGAAFNDDDTKAMMEASAGIKPVPWLRPDTSKPTPPLGPAYGQAAVARVKELLARLQEEDKMNEEKIHLY